VSAAQPTGTGGGGPFGPLAGPGAEIAGAANARPSRLAIATFVDAERMNDFLRIVTMMAPKVSQGRRGSLWQFEVRSLGSELLRHRSEFSY